MYVSDDLRVRCILQTFAVNLQNFISNLQVSFISWWACAKYTRENKTIKTIYSFSFAPYKRIIYNIYGLLVHSFGIQHHLYNDEFIFY